jgi:hypothetical protein
MTGWPCCLGPAAAQYVMVGVHARADLSWPKSKEKKRKGQRS